MIAILNRSSVTLKSVRLIPFIVIDPFSIIREANFLSNSKLNSRLPFFSITAIHLAVESTWPCTICPSNRLDKVRQRSKLIKEPFTQLTRFVLANVSSMAVTRCCPFFISSTVRQAPLWLTLWSAFNSEEIGDSTQNVVLLPFVMTLVIMPVASIIPVNMQQIYFFVSSVFEN